MKELTTTEFISNSKKIIELLTKAAELAKDTYEVSAGDEGQPMDIYSSISDTINAIQFFYNIGE